MSEMILMDEFEALRPRLFGIAYRMLGSAMEAEDIVQTAYGVNSIWVNHNNVLVTRAR